MDTPRLLATFDKDARDAKVRIAMSRLEDLVEDVRFCRKHVTTETQRLGCESNLSNLSCFEVFGWTWKWTTNSRRISWR